MGFLKDKLKKFSEVPDNVDLDELDRESKYKIFSPTGDKLLTIVLTIFALFQLYASISNKVPLQILRYTHLGFAVCLAFIVYPATKHASRRKLPWYDCLLSALFFCVVAYFIINYKPLQYRAGAYTTMDVIMAGLGILLARGGPSHRHHRVHLLYLRSGGRLSAQLPASPWVFPAAHHYPPVHHHQRYYW